MHVEVDDSSNEMYVTSYFINGNLSDDTCRIVVYDPSDDIIYSNDDIIRYLPSNDTYKAYTYIPLSDVEYGNYEVIYIIWNESNSYDIRGTFEILDTSNEHAFPLTYDTSDMKYKVYRYIMFCLICIGIFLYIASRP